jgi:pilus assembly protein Flp/PilA
MKTAIVAFLKDEEGLTTVEYAIAGALVGGGAIVAFRNLGSQVNRVIQAISTALAGVTITS